jgi:hypothetical protein
MSEVIKPNDIVIIQNNLTDLQLKVVQNVFSDAQKLAKRIISTQIDTTNSTVIIVQLVSELVALVQGIQINKQKLSGFNKKAVVIELGRLILEQTLDSNPQKDLILSIYKVSVDGIVDSLINVSKKINVSKSICCF